MADKRSPERESDTDTVPISHLHALIQEFHGPRASVRQLALQAGLTGGYINSYTKPSASKRRLPEPATISNIARAIGCPVPRVTIAMALDSEYDFGEATDSPDLQAVVQAYRELPKDAQPDVVMLLHRFGSLPARERATLMNVALSLRGGAS